MNATILNTEIVRQVQNISTEMERETYKYYPLSTYLDTNQTSTIPLIGYQRLLDDLGRFYQL